MEPEEDEVVEPLLEEEELDEVEPEEDEVEPLLEEELDEVEPEEVAHTGGPQTINAEESQHSLESHLGTGLSDGQLGINPPLHCRHPLLEDEELEEVEPEEDEVEPEDELDELEEVEPEEDEVEPLEDELEDELEATVQIGGTHNISAASQHSFVSHF